MGVEPTRARSLPPWPYAIPLQCGFQSVAERARPILFREAGTPAARSAQAYLNNSDAKRKKHNATK